MYNIKPTNKYQFKVNVFMKRILLFLTAIIGMTLQCKAQFEINIPAKRIVKLVNNVNLRKEPTTDSPKLMAKWEEEKNSDGMVVTASLAGYSWNETGKDYTYRTAHPDYLMIIDDNGEWYHSYALDSYSHEIPEVYVSKTAAKTKPVQKINVNYLKKCEVKYFIRDFGKYKGYYLISGGVSSMSSVDDYLFVGKNVDGILYGKLFAPKVDKFLKEIGFSELPSNYSTTDDYSDLMIDDLLKRARTGTIILIAGKVYTYYPKGSVEWDGFERFYFAPQFIK